jgi:hypothetical protein
MNIKTLILALLIFSGAAYSACTDPADIPHPTSGSDIWLCSGVHTITMNTAYDDPFIHLYGVSNVAIHGNYTTIRSNGSGYLIGYEGSGANNLDNCDNSDYGYLCLVL